MTDYPIAVVGVDPGGTTGVSILELTDTSVRLAATYQFTDQDTAHKELEQLLCKLALPIHLVVEQFDKRPGIIDPDFSAKYVERDIDNNVTRYDVKHKQTPSEAKNMVKEAPSNSGRGDGLHRFGMFSRGGMKHANDATRHAITYAVMKLRHRPTILLGWPKPKEDE